MLMSMTATMALTHDDDDEYFDDDIADDNGDDDICGGVRASKLNRNSKNMCQNIRSNQLPHRLSNHLGPMC